MGFLLLCWSRGGPPSLRGQLHRPNLLRVRPRPQRGPVEGHRRAGEVRSRLPLPLSLRMASIAIPCPYFLQVSPQPEHGVPKAGQAVPRQRGRALAPTANLPTELEGVQRDAKLDSLHLPITRPGSSPEHGQVASALAQPVPLGHRAHVLVPPEALVPVPKRQGDLLGD